MIGELAIVPVAAAAYFATNLDNFTVLVALLARYRRRYAEVILGYLACMFILVIIGWFIARAALLIPVHRIGLLGIVPLGMGIFGLAQLFMNSGGEGAASGKVETSSQAIFFVTLLTQLGNGTDTTITVAALFADSNPAADVLAVVTMGLMALAFVAAAIYAINHPALSQWVKRYAHKVTPVILIAIGIYILLNTTSDVVPG